MQCAWVRIKHVHPARKQRCHDGPDGGLLERLRETLGSGAKDIYTAGPQVAPAFADWTSNDVGQLKTQTQLLVTGRDMETVTDKQSKGRSDAYRDDTCCT